MLRAVLPRLSASSTSQQYSAFKVSGEPFSPEISKRLKTVALRRGFTSTTWMDSKCPTAMMGRVPFDGEHPAVIDVRHPAGDEGVNSGLELAELSVYNSEQLRISGHQETRKIATDWSQNIPGRQGNTEADADRFGAAEGNSFDKTLQQGGEKDISLSPYAFSRQDRRAPPSSPQEALFNIDGSQLSEGFTGMLHNFVANKGLNFSSPYWGKADYFRDVYGAFVQPGSEGCVREFRSPRDGKMFVATFYNVEQTDRPDCVSHETLPTEYVSLPRRKHIRGHSIRLLHAHIIRYNLGNASPYWASAGVFNRFGGVLRPDAVGCPLVFPTFRIIYNGAQLQNMDAFHTMLEGPSKGSE